MHPQYVTHAKEFENLIQTNITFIGEANYGTTFGGWLRKH